VPLHANIDQHHNHLRPFFRDHPGETVPEENFWALWCKGRLTEADTPTIRLGATPCGLSSAHLYYLPGTRVSQQRIKGKALLHMYALSVQHALLPFSWYRWRFNHRIHQVPPLCSTNQHIIPWACVSQPSKWHRNRFSRFCTAYPLVQIPMGSGNFQGDTCWPIASARGSFNHISASLYKHEKINPFYLNNRSIYSGYIICTIRDPSLPIIKSTL